MPSDEYSTAPGVLMMAVTVGENGSLERKRTSALWLLGTAVFLIWIKQKLYNVVISMHLISALAWNEHAIYTD